LASTDSRTFVTLFYAVYDAGAKTLRYCNAGHNPPFLLKRDGSISLLEAGGPIAGAFDWKNFDEETLPFNSGDRLLIYTDGVTEAEDPTEEQFGEDRLEELLKREAHAGSQALIDHVVADVLAFQKDAPVMDDITVVSLRAE
jgi:sigma-B regulation protein RsbU (phosphoserine phosphatase)